MRLSNTQAVCGAILAGSVVVGGACWWWASRVAPIEDAQGADAQPARSVPIPSDLNSFDPDIAKAIRQAVADVRGGGGQGEKAAWLRLAVVYDAHEIFELARPCYELAVELDPEDVRAWYNLGMVRGTLGDLPGACAAMEEVMKLDDTYAPCFWRIGFWQLDLGDLDAAELAFQRAAVVDPAQNVSQIGLASVHLQRQQWERAIQLLEPIAAADEQNSRYAFHLLSRAYRGMGRTDDVAAASVSGVGGGLSFVDPWREEINQSRSGMEAKLREVNRLLSTGARDQALALIAEMRRNAADDARLLTLVGVPYRTAGLLAESESVLAAAVAREPSYYPAQLALARTLATVKGRDEEALAHVERALQLNPTLAAGHALRGELLLRGNDPSGAAASFHEAARCAPAGVRFLYQAALAESRLQRWDAAAATLELVAKRLPNRTRVHQQLGVAYLNLGRWEDAAASLDRAHQLTPNDPQVLAAMKRLAKERELP